MRYLFNNQINHNVFSISLLFSLKFFLQLSAADFPLWGGYGQIWGRIVHYLLKPANFQEWQN